MSPFTKYTFPQVLAIQAKRWGTARVAIREKAYGIWHAYTWQDYLRYTRHTALGLIALGFRRGEAAGRYSVTRAGLYASPEEIFEDAHGSVLFYDGAMGELKEVSDESWTV